MIHLLRKFPILQPQCVEHESTSIFAGLMLKDKFQASTVMILHWSGGTIQGCVHGWAAATLILLSEQAAAFRRQVGASLLQEEMVELQSLQESKFWSRTVSLLQCCGRDIDLLVSLSKSHGELPSIWHTSTSHNSTLESRWCEIVKQRLHLRPPKGSTNLLTSSLS